MPRMEFTTQPIASLFLEYTMKNVRTLCAALALVLCLTVPASAGEIDCGIAPPPPQNSATVEESPSLAEAALSLIQSVLAIF